MPPEDVVVSSLVNSPTTDTLDSVALETSPIEEQDLVVDDLLSTSIIDRATKGQTQAAADRDDRMDTGIVITSPADFSIDLNSSVIPSAVSSQENLFGEKDVGASLSVPHTDETLPQSHSISSYFNTMGDGADFFDTLEGLQDSPVKQIAGFGDRLGSTSQIPTGSSSNTKPVEEEIGQGEFQAELFQPFPAAETEQDIAAPSEATFTIGGMEADITRIYHREHKISQSEPETVAFEGEDDLNENNISELTEKDEEFESFTADTELTPTPTNTPSFVERSDSMPQGYPVASSEQQAVKSEDISTGFQSLGIHGPSVGTTPTQMSPLHTPVHQPAFAPPSSSQMSPQTVLADPPRYDRQSSIPKSPYHGQSDSGPPSGAFPSFGDVSGGDDIFTASLSVSDTDRRFDAWIPSDATRHILIAMATSQPGTYCPAVEQLSIPGVLNKEPQGDPVRDLVFRYMGEQESFRRQVLMADSVSQDFDGLKKLVEAGCLRAAVDLTGRLLTAGGQGDIGVGQAVQHSPQMMQLWYCRMALLVKLRLYEMAESEMRAFQTLDTPDLYFEFYPQIYPGRRGSMVCFAMRLLHADLPHLNGRSQEALDRLYYILAVVRKIMTNLDNDLCEDGSAGVVSPESRKLSQELWVEREKQVLYKIASTLLSVRDYQAALTVYNMLLDKDPTHRADLLTGVSRIHLQMGNVTMANEIHLEVEKLVTKGDNISACRNAMNKGLSAMCVNNFSEAYSHFKTAVQLEPTSTCAVNNMAVCSLYLGRLKDALNTLESIVHSDPARNLHEGILFNLCTLYELESSRALHKKQAVLDMVSKHKGDGFPIACLKMA